MKDIWKSRRPDDECLTVSRITFYYRYNLRNRDVKTETVIKTGTSGPKEPLRSYGDLPVCICVYIFTYQGVSKREYKGHSFTDKTSKDLRGGLPQRHRIV